MASLILFLGARSKDFSDSKSREYFVFILALGTLIRLVLAWYSTGNYDRESWEIVAKIAAAGGNVYAESARYNSSPVWFWVLGLLQHLADTVHLPLRFLFRVFLSVVDLGTAGLLYTLAGKDASFRFRAGLFFFLNPVSFLLTGYHGQFDNFAIFFLVLALWGKDRFQTGWAWFWTTVGFIVKHIIFYELLILILNTVRQRWARLLFFVTSCLLFAAVFLPYWKEGKEGILKNVLFYRSYTMPYGLSAFGPSKALTAVFVIALFLYPFFIRKREVWEQALLGTLFFLTFTTGVGVQYFILPIALGAARPSRGFFVYSLVTSGFLLGSYFNMGIKAFSWIPMWSVWVAAAFWWVSVHSQPPKAA